MRKIDVVVISDVHLGTYGCHAKELIQYLDSIHPKKLILNGDIIDGWQFKKRYFPKEHYKVLQLILKKLKKGTKVYYLTGNHDDFLRKISGISMGEFKLLDHLYLDIHGKKHWFFHGDIFDASVKISPFIAKLGGYGYDWLIVLNRILNKCLSLLDKEPMSFSKKIKNSVKNAVKFIGDFEQAAIQMAAHEKHDVVVCGHIHQPTIRTVQRQGKEILYMNAGDWVENLTSLEYYNKEWHLFHFEDMQKKGPKKKYSELEESIELEEVSDVI